MNNYLDTQSAYQHELQGAKMYRQIGDVDGMVFCLEHSARISIQLGRLTSVVSMLAQFLEQSAAPEERIRLLLEERNKGLLLFQGEWFQALEYFRALLTDRRKRQMPQWILSLNSWVATTQIELHRITGSGDLAEAEAALLENLELERLDPESQTKLVQVYSLQGRFAEAHALLAELFKAPVKFRLEAKASHAMAERRWNQAESTTRSLIHYLQSVSRRWEWARALIDLGDIYAQRGQPGDIDRAREAYQQSLDMFSEMEATGYVQALRQRLQALTTV